MSTAQETKTARFHAALNNFHQYPSFGHLGQLLDAVPFDPLLTAHQRVAALAYLLLPDYGELVQSHPANKRIQVFLTELRNGRITLGVREVASKAVTLLNDTANDFHAWSAKEHGGTVFPLEPFRSLAFLSAQLPAGEWLLVNSEFNLLGTVHAGVLQPDLDAEEQAGSLFAAELTALKPDGVTAEVRDIRRLKPGWFGGEQLPAKFVSAWMDVKGMNDWYDVAQADGLVKARRIVSLSNANEQVLWREGTEVKKLSMLAALHRTGHLTTPSWFKFE